MRMQKELLQAERLAATGETVAGLAHAIKNILGGLKGGRYLVNQGFERNEIKYLKDGWGMVERNIEKISGLTQDLLTFCREREPEREPVNPNDLIRELFNLFHVQCQQQGVLLTLDLDDEMGTVALDPKGIHGGPDQSDRKRPGCLHPGGRDHSKTGNYHQEQSAAGRKDIVGSEGQWDGNRSGGRTKNI